MAMHAKHLHTHFDKGMTSAFAQNLLLQKQLAETNECELYSTRLFDMHMK